MAVVDVGLPDIDGIEVARRLRRRMPETHVLMLTATIDAGLLPRAMEAGASGFLLKESGVDELVDAIHKVHGGQVVIPQRTMSRLVSPSPRSPANPLTARETQVLAFLTEGGDLKGIAKTLGISWHTVRSHVKSVLAKLDARSQLEAVSKGMRMGILSVPERSATDPE